MPKLTSERARELAKLSQKKWEENGRKPRGFAANPQLAREAGAKGTATVNKRRKNK